MTLLYIYARNFIKMFHPGVIMGSEKTTTVTQCFLDRAEYKDLSARTQSTFASKRTTIYDIFQAYLNKKRLRGDYDAADRSAFPPKFLLVMLTRS